MKEYTQESRSLVDQWLVSFNNWSVFKYQECNRMHLRCHWWWVRDVWGSLTSATYGGVLTPPAIPHSPPALPLAQCVALSHDKYDLDLMDKFDIKLDNKQKMNIYLSRNRYNCKIVIVNSTSEDFLRDYGTHNEIIYNTRMREKDHDSNTSYWSGPIGAELKDALLILKKVKNKREINNTRCNTACGSNEQE